jgi:hypothetical protein
MTAYIQTVLTTAVAGREDEFNRWYDGTHLPEMLQVPGFVAGRRYALTAVGAADRSRFLAAYEIETQDLAAPLAALAAAAPTMTVSDAMDQPSAVVELYEVLGERRTPHDMPTTHVRKESDRGRQPVSECE